MTKRIKLTEYIERRIVDDGLVVELPDGTEVTVPPAELWPDSSFEALGEGKTGEAVALILGGDQYLRFVAAGGNWRIINGMIAEQQGVTPGESVASLQP